MSDFVDLPLLKRLNKKNIISRIENVERKTDVKPSARLASLSELSQNLGEMSAGVFKCIDPATGALRGYMTAVPRPEASGYHLAFFDNSGILQWGGSADNGKLYAGGGAVVLDEDGISIADIGDSIAFFSAIDNTYCVFSQTNNQSIGKTVLRVLVASVSSLTNLLTNGDFETGSFSSWTETDPGGNISISSNGAGYGGGYAAFFDEATLSDFLTQNVSSSSYGVLVRLRLKASGGPALAINGTTVLSGVETNGLWRTFYFIVPGTVTSIKIALAGAGSACYVDDIVALPIGGIGTTSFSSYTDFAPNGIIGYTHMFSLRDINDNEVVKVELDGANKLIQFNPDALDLDTVVRGDVDANLTYWDAGNDRVGIGANDPAVKLDVNSDSIRVRTAKTPSSATDTGVAGQICWDASYVYVCTATNTWRRAAIAAW